MATGQTGDGFGGHIRTMRDPAWTAARIGNAGGERKRAYSYHPKMAGSLLARDERHLLRCRWMRRKSFGRTDVVIFAWPVPRGPCHQGQMAKGDSCIYWRGDHPVSFNGHSLPMRSVTGRTTEPSYDFDLNCDLGALPRAETESVLVSLHYTRSSEM